ncbi:MAG: HU family DNA-binding protein [Odoribacteraceae bacterium]|jgi:predicted histone-like DNA-binding protein|nr:HU family DNA-binding protein [Odoribacteraceae bacterium]
MMGVKIVVHEKSNPSDPTAPKKWYASAVANGDLTFRRLSKEVADGSTTVSDTDVLAVLNDLIKLLCRHLSNGEIVRLGDFGTFQISVSSEGAETEEKFHASMIKSSKVIFRPGIDLKEMQKTLKFEKA